VDAVASWPVLGIAGAILSLITALITALATISLNQAKTEAVRKDAQKSKADTAEVFNKIANDWTTRIVQSNERLDARIALLVTVVENLTDAVDHVAPLLEPLAGDPVAAAKVHDLNTAARAARLAI